MILVACVLLGAVAAGWLGGGRLRNLAHVSLRGTWLVFLAVGLQATLMAASAAGAPVEPLARPLLSASYLSLFAFAVANRYLPGMLLVVLGFGLNAAAIVANGAMPVAGDSLLAAGGLAELEPGKHRLLADGDALPWLADVIAIRLLRTVVSVGDVVLAAGVGLLVPGLMRRYPPEPGRRARPRPRGVLPRVSGSAAQPVHGRREPLAE